MPILSNAQTGSAPLFSKLAAAQGDSAHIEAYKTLIVYYSASRQDSANLIATQAIEYSRQHNYPLGEGRILAQQGILDENQGRVELATERTTRALDIFRKLHHMAGVAEMLHNLGAIEASKGNSDITAERFISALKVYDSIKDAHGQMLTYMNLGNLYAQRQDTANAWKYLRLADNVSKTIPLSESTIFLYNVIGVMYAQQGDVEKAETIFLSDVEMSNKPEFINAHIECLLYLAEFYSENNNGKKALEYLRQGLAAARANHLPEMEANFLMEIARTQEETNPAEAIATLNQAKALCEEVHSKAFLEAVYTELAKVYKKQGNFKEALSATEEKQKLDDSIFSINKEKDIANITSSYELAKSKLQVDELQRDKKQTARQMDIIVVVAICIIVLLVILFFYYRKTTTLNKKLIINEQELKELNSMKDKLFSVIGHDLRGPIARIPTIIELYESDNTTDEERKFLLDSLKEHTKISLETFDKLLYWGRSLVKGVRLQQVKVKPKSLISEAVALRKMRIAEKNITLTCNTPENLTVFADPALFDFIIRNLIANALKYTYPGDTIEINADTTASPGFTVFSVKDNGIGMDESVRARLFQSLKSTEGTMNEKGHGIGLMLCKEFAMLNGGDIWVESEPGKGSTFYFSVKNAA